MSWCQHLGIQTKSYKESCDQKDFRASDSPSLNFVITYNIIDAMFNIQAFKRPPPIRFNVVSGILGFFLQHN